MRGRGSSSRGGGEVRHVSRRGGAKMVKVLQEFLNKGGSSRGTSTTSTRGRHASTRQPSLSSSSSSSSSSLSTTSSRNVSVGIPLIETDSRSSIQDHTKIQIHHLDNLIHTTESLLLKDDIPETFGESKEEMLERIRVQEVEIRQLKNMVAHFKAAYTELKSNMTILADTNTLQNSAILSFARDCARTDPHFNNNGTPNSISLLPFDSMIYKT